jgi:hypothetical protein
MASIIHIGGCHAALVPRIWLTAEVSETFRFLPNCEYEHGDDDQWDWNKLCGIDFRMPFQPLKAVMVGWRWNPRATRFELCAYINDPVKGRFMSDTLASVQSMQPFSVRIWRESSNRWAISVWAGGESTTERQKVSFDNRRGLPVWGWFGGNKPAPHFMEIQRGVSLETF